MSAPARGGALSREGSPRLDGALPGTETRDGLTRAELTPRKLRYAEWKPQPFKSPNGEGHTRERDRAQQEPRPCHAARGSLGDDYTAVHRVAAALDR
jgi:hypothetical protein